MRGDFTRKCDQINRRQRIAIGLFRAGKSCGDVALADGMDPARLQNALIGTPDNGQDALAYDFGASTASGDIIAAVNWVMRLTQNMAGPRARNQNWPLRVAGCFPQ